MAEHNLTRFCAAFAICLLAGYADLYFFTTSIPEWYSTLAVPAFVPPALDIFYGIIVMAFLLAFSLYFILKQDLKKNDIRMSLILFIFGLALNVLWFITFFYFRSAFMALMIMIMVLTVLACLIYQTLRTVVISSVFLVPYLIIMLIAAYADLQIVLLNPNLPVWGNF
ncbi:MAG: TspO/MBR family protein [Methanoregula sp.]|jgi:tryptophan-rich sensory protein